MYIPVVSSNIDALKHNGSLLFVKFKNGGEYSYQNVDSKTFHEILTAASVGRTFFQLINSSTNVHIVHKLS